MNPSPTTGLVERLRSAGDIEQMLSEGHRSLHREAADALEALSLPQPTVDREAIARAVLDGWYEGNIEWDDAPVQWRDNAYHAADAILALLNPQALKVGSEGGGA